MRKTLAERLATKLPRGEGEPIRQYQARRLEAVLRDLRRDWPFVEVARSYGYKPEALRLALRRLEAKTGEPVSRSSMAGGKGDQPVAHRSPPPRADPWASEADLSACLAAFLEALRRGERPAAAASAAGFLSIVDACLAVGRQQLIDSGETISIAAARDALPTSKVYRVAQAAILSLTSIHDLARNPGPAIKMVEAASRLIEEAGAATEPWRPILVTGKDATDEERRRTAEMIEREQAGEPDQKSPPHSTIA